MTTAPDPNALLMGSGAKSASFNGAPPITVSGRIVTPPDVQQQTNLKGELLTFPDGKPRWQVIVQVQTTERDPADPADDGVRALYIKANSQKAVAEAIRKAGGQGLEVGAMLSLTYIGDDNSKPPRPGFNQPKLYTATYQPPSVAAVGQVLGVAQAPAAAPQPAPAPAPAAQLNGSDEDIALIRNAGLDPANVDIPATANVLRTMNATKVA